MSNRKFEIDFGILKSTEKLNNEQFGTLLRALISYAKDGTETEFDDLAMSLAFDAQKVMIDNKKAEYNDKCEKNRQNVMKRWQKNSDTTVYDRIPSYKKNTTVSPNSFNNSNSIYINNINKDIQTTSYKKEKNTIINDSKKEKVSSKKQANIAASTSDADTHTLQFEKDKYLLALFDKIWSSYPRKVGKEQAKKTWVKKFNGLMTKADIDQKAIRVKQLLTAHISAWSKETNKLGEVGRLVQYMPHFSTWLNDEIPDKDKV